MVHQNYFIIEVKQLYFTAELGKAICKLIYETGKLQKDK